jgi:hypothetical protein
VKSTTEPRRHGENTRVKKALAIFELIAGLVLAYAVIVMFFSLAGISAPILNIWFFLYWGALASGPVLLIVGSVWTLITFSKNGVKILMLGALIIFAWSLYLVAGFIEEVRRTNLTTAPTAVTSGLVILALLSVLAAYKLIRWTT